MSILDLICHNSGIKVLIFNIASPSCFLRAAFFLPIAFLVAKIKESGMTTRQVLTKVTEQYHTVAIFFCPLE